MVDSKRPSNLNAYIQGSVWTWGQGNSKPFETNREGVQSRGRPVLIISNNTHNQWSPSVNCLTITSVLKNSPVHVLVTLDVESHIQCEQVQTISKNELTEYRGVIPAITLSNVKEKLKIQFDMNTDKSLEMLSEVKSSIDELNERAADGFGLQTLTGEISQLLVNTHNCFTYIKTELSNMQGENVQSHAETAEQIETPVNDLNPAKKATKKRRGYSEEDIKLIIDDANSISDLMKRFNFKDKRAAYSTRSYFKKKQSEQKSDVDDKDDKSDKSDKSDVHRGRRAYTDEDKEFITNEANSITDIINRFSYKDKATAYKMRSYFKKNSANAN